MSVTSVQYKKIAAKAAAGDSVIRKNGRACSVPSVGDYKDIIVDTYKKILQYPQQGDECISESRLLSEEWLADNYHIISEQIAAAV